MTTEHQTKLDLLAPVTGHTARKMYEQAQEAIKKGELPAEMGITRNNSFLAPLEYLYVVDGYNVREELKDKKIRMFADRYKLGLYVPPIEVRAINGRFQVIEGHHRYHGAHLAKEEGASLARLSLVIFEGDENEAILRMMNSAEGEKLSPLEIAGGYKRLINQGMTEKEIAAARQQSTIQIVKMLKLANASLAVKALIRDGSISATRAIEIIEDCERDGGDPVAIMKDDIAFAKSQGKERATKKHSATARSKPKALPRKHVESAISTLLESNLAQQLRDSLPAEDAENADSDLPVTFKASEARQLLAALEEMNKFKAEAAANAKPDANDDASQAAAS